MSINPRVFKTISYAWPDEQYQTIKFLWEKENRKMRNMLFHIVEKYVENLPESTKAELHEYLNRPEGPSKPI